MTEPAPPAPGAPAQPAPPPTAPPPAPAAPPPAPGQGPDPNAPVDVNALPANVQNLIKQLRAEAAKNRTDPKTAADAARKDALAQVAKALGLAGDNPPDPEQLMAQVEAAQDAAWASAVELEVYRIAASAGANPDSLLDSRGFIGSLDPLVDLDPRSEEFKTQLRAKVQEAAAKHPAQPTPGASNGPRPDPTQGPRGNPPTARPTSLGAAVGAHYKPS